MIFCLGGRLEDSVDYDAYGKIDLKAHGTSDFDMDGDVDGLDWTTFVTCFNQSGNPPRPGCTVGMQADYDNDGDVDAIDFTILSSCYNGSGKPPRTIGCGPNAVETIDITESRHANSYFFTGRWLNQIKAAAGGAAMWFREFLPGDLYDDGELEAVKVSLDGKGQPAAGKSAETSKDAKPAKDAKRKVEAGKKRPQPALETKRKVDAGGSEAFDVPLLADFGTVAPEPSLFEIFATCTNGANNPPKQDAICTPKRVAVLDFDSDGDIDVDDFDTFARCYHGPDEPIACENADNTTALLAIAPTTTSPLGAAPLAAAPLAGGGTAMASSAGGLQLYYYRERTMDPVLGRFMQKDPLGEAHRIIIMHDSGRPQQLSDILLLSSQYDDGMNVRSYVQGNPSRWPDPLGLVCGSGGSDKFIPDSEFGPCCQKHDNCYSDCTSGPTQNGPTRNTCDGRFASCLKDTCKRKYPNFGSLFLRLNCLIRASVYHAAVRAWGLGPFNNARRKCERDCLNKRLEDLGWL